MTSQEETQELTGNRVKVFYESREAVRLSLELKTFELFAVSREELLSISRMQYITYARFALWYSLHKSLGYSFSEICRLYSRDHSSIIHGINFVTDLLKREANRPPEKLLQQNTRSLMYVAENADISKTKLRDAPEVENLVSGG